MKKGMISELVIPGFGVIYGIAVLNAIAFYGLKPSLGFGWGQNI